MPCILLAVKPHVQGALPDCALINEDLYSTHRLLRNTNVTYTLVCTDQFSYISKENPRFVFVPDDIDCDDITTIIALQKVSNQVSFAY